MRALAPSEVAEAFRAACLAELSALKPGNVHVFAAGHGMETAQFEAAAAAAAPAIARGGASVGARVLAAVEASLAVAGCNTNLGIILLCAPLAVAAEGGGPLRDQLVQVLDGLDRADAGNAFRAIAAASPGGLGASAEADVRAPASVTLREAMALAADRDAIARQYVTGYADLFTRGIPVLAGDPLERERIEDAYLAFLATLPDSHIARKFGPEQAEVVRTEAVALRGGLSGLSPGERHDALLAFDTSLKARGLNPGTSADLTVASIFAALIEQQAKG
jgi:triphosphoribosyl-dephospho-CoA synthase